MGLALGIQIGHDCSCAVVRDGELLSAVQLERVSRVKYHTTLNLTNQLPVSDALAAAGAEIGDVDIIVSSIQSAAPAGYGLNRPIVAEDFALFDPWQQDHWIISHHLAHAYCALGSSPFAAAAVIVCDYAGSTTLRGEDYALPFDEYYRSITDKARAFETKTECLSIYAAQRGNATMPDRGGCSSYELLHREWNISHPQQTSFVYSVAGLYENVSRYVFGRHRAHGQLMALAAFAERPPDRHAWDPGPLVRVSDSDEVEFRNDWQHELPEKPSEHERAILAWRCQEATEAALLAYARRAHQLTGSENLAAAGGVFLNIVANSRIVSEGPYQAFHVPSSPHDAGISVGCAFFGAEKLGDTPKGTDTSDRLGRVYSASQVEDALSRFEPFIEWREFGTSEIVQYLVRGQIVGRWSGRAEFGPRALGGRSLLGSPVLSSTKDRLNSIKGRQSWRPVAPVVSRERVGEFFDGESESPWMLMAYRLRDEHQSSLPALSHPDSTARVQTLRREADPQLYDWIEHFAQRTGFPILVNTSLNRGGEPMIETPAQAIEMFLDQPGIDFLVVGDWIVSRCAPWAQVPDHAALRLASDTLLVQAFEHGRVTHVATHGKHTWKVSVQVVRMLRRMGRADIRVESVLATFANGPDLEQLYDLLIKGAIELQVS